MIKLLFFGSISIVLIQSSFGQITTSPPLPSGWERIHINNLGCFDLPPTMEVQKGKYKEGLDAEKQKLGINASQLTAQPKGLNEFGKTESGKYARVIVETTFGSAGDFEKLNFDISAYSAEYISELNSQFKQQIQQSFYSTGLKLVEWYPFRVEKINGMSCMHVSYKRQLLDKPAVLVHQYYFQNNDRMHHLTLSYRFSEAEYWKADFERILKSFRISDVR